MEYTIEQKLLQMTHGKLVDLTLELYEALRAWDELRAMQPLDSGDDIRKILHKCCSITDKALAKAEGK